MRKIVLAGLIGAHAISAQSFAQEAAPGTEISSAYTDLKIDENCAVYKKDMLGGSFVCAGYKGYSVLFQEGDARESVFYGFVGDWFGKGAFESFQPFNNTGDTIEWRLEGDVPYAAILRWYISVEDGTAAGDQAQVLVISKVAQPEEGEGCVAGYVDAAANANANQLARQIADDLVRDFQCRIDVPEFHGNAGVVSDYPMRTFEQ